MFYFCKTVGPVYARSSITILNLSSGKMDSTKEESIPSSETIAPPTLSLDSYVGAYNDLGYGNITLCASTTDSPYCKSVLKDFEPFPDPIESEGSSPTLYASLRNMWGSHLRLRHQGGDEFTILMTYLFPNGYGRNTTAFETWETGSGEGTVKFVVSDAGEVEGFGLFIMEELTERRRIGGTIEETADAWFSRV